MSKTGAETPFFPKSEMSNQCLAPGSTTAEGGFGSCETTHSIATTDPTAKTTIAIMLPHRKEKLP